MIISGIPWKAINTNKFNHGCLASFSKTTFLKNQFLDVQFCKNIETVLGVKSRSIETRSFNVKVGAGVRA